MKESNVLEAIDLCVNGNPAMYYDPHTIEQVFFRLWHSDDLLDVKIYNPYKHAMFGKYPRLRKEGGNVPPPRNPLPPPQSRTGTALTDHPVYLRALKDLEKEGAVTIVRVPEFDKRNKPRTAVDNKCRVTFH